MAHWRPGGFALSNATVIAMADLFMGGYRPRPTVLLLAALVFYQTRPGLAGLMVGLSVAAKFIPGLLMLVCCLPELRRSRYITGFILGLTPVIVFFLLSHWDFAHNTMWVLAAKPDASSWLYGASFYMIIITRIAFILIVVAVSAVIVVRPPDFLGRCNLYVICVATILLTARYHNNYALWWLPFFCILLGPALSKILSFPGSSSAVSDLLCTKRAQPARLLEKLSRP
jgi:hypothetical protein